MDLSNDLKKLFEWIMNISIHMIIHIVSNDIIINIRHIQDPISNA